MSDPRWRDEAGTTHALVIGDQVALFGVVYVECDHTVCGLRPPDMTLLVNDEITCAVCLDALSPIDPAIERAIVDAWAEAVIA